MSERKRCSISGTKLKMIWAISNSLKTAVSSSFVTKIVKYWKLDAAIEKREKRSSHRRNTGGWKEANEATKQTRSVSHDR